MIDATSELMAAIRAALLSNPVIATDVGQRISTDWGLKLDAPFIRLAVPDVLPFEDDCAGPGSAYTVHVHVFSRGGAAALSRLVDSVRVALDDTSPPLATSSLWWLMFAGAIRHTDPDDPSLSIARVAFDAATTTGT